jgi:mannitol-specific phosphotransferase system IIBC component
LFVILFVLLMVLIQNLFVALMTAAIVSSVISVFALRKQRDALSASIATRAERASQKMAERSASEDSWDEAQRAAADPEPDAGSEPGRL